MKLLLVWPKARTDPDWGGDLGAIAEPLALEYLAAAAIAAKSILHRLLRNPNPLWQILLAIPLLFLGWPLTWIWTTLIDPIYLHSGPRFRQ